MKKTWIRFLEDKNITPNGFKNIRTDEIKQCIIREYRKHLAEFYKNANYPMTFDDFVWVEVGYIDGGFYSLEIEEQSKIHQDFSHYLTAWERGEAV